jgi:hypothetical protein
MEKRDRMRFLRILVRFFGLVGGDWNHGMDYDFPFSWEWKIIPTDELAYFSEG